MGYGLVAAMIQIRTAFLPNYVTVTRNINIIHASLYTGAFLAVISNLRYQVLQGIAEPIVEFYAQKLPILKGFLILALRIANGLLGSILAISGMKLLGLQRLK